MSCNAQGLCRICRKKHTMPIFGGDKTAHALLQHLNLKLVVLNTVCSPCIEGSLKKIDLPFDEMTVEKIRGTIIEDPTKFTTDQNVSSADLQILGRSRIHDDFQTRSGTIDSNEIDATSTTIGDAHRTKEVAKIDVDGNKRHDSVDSHLEIRTGIDNSRVASERKEDTGGARKRQRQLTCDFCRKEFNHTGDLNKHRRTHTGEQPYTCNKCRQRFSYASNLARHRRVHSGERPFSCRTCGRTFARKDKFSAHLTAEQCSYEILRSDR